MKHVLVGLALSFASVTAMAHAGGGTGTIGHNGDYRIECTDPSLFQYFSTASEAANMCPRYDNVYVTYDWGHRAYTCGCQTPDDNGQNSGGAF